MPSDLLPKNLSFLQQFINKVIGGGKISINPSVSKNWYQVKILRTLHGKQTTIESPSLTEEEVMGFCAAELKERLNV